MESISLVGYPMTAFPIEVALAIKARMAWINEDTREFCLFAPDHPQTMSPEDWHSVEWFAQRVMTLLILEGYHPVKPWLDVTERLN